CCGGHVRDGDLLLRRALRDDLAVDDLEIVGIDLELLARDLENSLSHLERGLLRGLARDERRARRERSGADGRRVGVRVVVGDPVVGDADRLGHDLRLDRLRAVADVGGAGEDVDAPVGLDLDPRLRRVAVLIHPRRVLDRRDAAALMDSHQWSFRRSWWMPGVREPSQARTQGAFVLANTDATEDADWRRVIALRARPKTAGRATLVVLRVSELGDEVLGEQVAGPWLG